MTDHYVRPDVRAFLDFLNAAGTPPLSQLSPAEARESYMTMKVIGDLDARELAVVRDLTCPGPAGEIPLRFYDPRESREPGPVMVFYHGGGFVIGDLDTHDTLCRELAAELDLPLLAVHYRLAPEHPFPAAPDDCEAATRWLAASPETLGRSFTGLIPIGDSAGGNLAIVITQTLMDAPAEVPVVLQVPIYPAADERDDHRSMLDFSEGFLLTQDTMGFFMTSYAGEAGNARAFPILGSHAAMPPTVLVTASLDPIRDSGRAYGAQLILAGSDVVFVEMKGTVHGFTTLRKALPSANDDFAQIVKAIRYMLERGQ
jgi:acetyl esterase